MSAIEFHHGDPLMIDHTPGADVAAGAGVNVNGEIHVAHRAITSGELGALAAPSGKGVYKVTKKTGGSEAYSAGADVPFNFTTQQADTAGTATVGLTCIETVVAADTYVFCRHGA